MPVRSSEGWRRGFPETRQHSPGRRSAPRGVHRSGQSRSEPREDPRRSLQAPTGNRLGSEGPPCAIRRGGGAGDGGKIGGRVLTGPGRGWPVTGRRPDGGEDLLAGRLKSGRSTPARRLAWKAKHAWRHGGRGHGAIAPAKVHRASGMATRPEGPTGRAKVHCGAAE